MSTDYRQPPNGLAAVLCLVSGHNPEEAREHGDLRWYTATGLVMLAIASLSAFSAFELLHEAMGSSTGFAVIGAVFAFLFVYCVDLFINMTPRRSDSLRHRLVFLTVRGPLGLVIAAFIGLGTALHLNQDDINAYVAQQAASHSAADVTTFTNSAPQTNQINADNKQISTLQKQDSAMEQTVAQKKADWWQDMVPCHGSGSVTCAGDTPGWGPKSRVLYADYQDYLTKTAQPAEKADSAQIASLRADITKAQASLAVDQKRLAAADQADTGLAAKTRALLHIMSQNWVLWILPIVILAWDQTLVLTKVLFPRRRTEIAAQQRLEDDSRARDEIRENATQLAAERASNPAWQAARAEAQDLAAATWLVEEKARLAKRMHAAERAAQGVGDSASRAGRALRPRMRPVTALVAVIALAAGFGGAALLTAGHGHATAQGSQASSGAVAAAVKPISVHVSPSEPVTVSVPKVGTLTAAKGSFSSPGTMTVTASKAALPSTDGVTPGGLGIVATFSGTKLTKPVTLTFADASRPSPGAIPVIAHRADNGQWNYLRASVTGSGMLTVSTSQFSLNMPGWVSNAAQWLGNRLASWLGGRTPDLTCSGAPSWFHVAIGHSDLVHVCAKDAGPDGNGVDRAEIQIKSNRGVSIQVDVPGNPQYVWVQNQPWPVRQVEMAVLSQDPNKTVILPAGATMTIGYVRTSSDQDLTATVSGYTGLALLDTVIRQALDYTVGDVDPAFVSYLVFGCASGLGLALITTNPSISDNGLSGVLKCIFSQAVGGVGDNAGNATRLMNDFVQRTGHNVPVSVLENTAKALSGVSDLTVLLPALQATDGNLWDAMKSWYTGGVANQVSYSIDGSTPTPSGPLVSSPGGLQGGSGTGAGIQGGSDTGSAIQGGNAGPGGSTPGGTGSGSGFGSGSGSGSGSLSGPGSGAGEQGGGNPAPGTMPHIFYDNYADTADGIAMCRGNQANTQSTPGGTVTETFTADAAGTINSAKVNIDPDTTVTATASLIVNGATAATASEPATGDVLFTFQPTAVTAGEAVTLRITFTATYGKLITVYEIGNPGGTFTVVNSCGAGAQNFTKTGIGLRAVVSGTS